MKKIPLKFQNFGLILDFGEQTFYAFYTDLGMEELCLALKVYFDGVDEVTSRIQDGQTTNTTQNGHNLIAGSHLSTTNITNNTINASGFNQSQANIYKYYDQLSTNFSGDNVLSESRSWTETSEHVRFVEDEIGVSAQ